MLNREWKDCIIVSFTTAKDELGQIRRERMERPSKCVSHPYQHTNIDNPIFADVSRILLFHPSVGITLNDQVIVDGETRNILYIQKDRYIQVFVK